jgi:hypothetical protein
MKTTKKGSLMATTTTDTDQVSEYSMTVGGKTYRSDTLTDLVNVFTRSEEKPDGFYAELPSLASTPQALAEASYEVRVLVAEHQVEALRQICVAAALDRNGLACPDSPQDMVRLGADNGLWDFQTVDDLLAFPVALPTEGIVGAEWANTMPLIVSTSAFLDGTAPPTGNVVWIDPTSDRTLLQSLADAAQSLGDPGSQPFLTFEALKPADSVAHGADPALDGLTEIEEEVS